MKMERIRGIEPLSKAWEAFVLPLNYIRKENRHNSQKSFVNLKLIGGHFKSLGAKSPSQAGQNT